MADRESGRPFKCWILPDLWICHVDSPEIPLEVCRLCVEARLGNVTVRRRPPAAPP